MDIDIDISPVDREFILDQLPCIEAMLIQEGQVKKHPVGVYFQNIPTDFDTGFSAIPYDQAAEYGYYKFDFLNLHLLKYFESHDEIKMLLDREPDWSLLENKENIEQLFHIKNYSEVVLKIAPKSVEELADCIAIIRPGKMQYLDRYCRDKDTVRELLYRKEGETKSTFRKSHAIAYSLNIILQLHLLKAGIKL